MDTTKQKYRFFADGTYITADAIVNLDHIVGATPFSQGEFMVTYTKDDSPTEYTVQVNEQVFHDLMPGHAAYIG